MGAMEHTPTRALAERAKKITQRELQAYMARTTGSQRATDRARKVLPMGVPSSFQAYDPHPLVVRQAQDWWMEDVDGHRYVDYDMGYGALFAGHCHPAVRAAITHQLDYGTLFVTPSEGNAEVAELLAEQGLDALVHKPTAGVIPSNWKPYIDKLPSDPWGHPYQYVVPGLKGEVDVFSFGADGQTGGEGRDADIGS